jgi:hypothetical protein
VVSIYKLMPLAWQMPHQSPTAGSIKEASALLVLNHQQPAISPLQDLTALLAQPAVLLAHQPQLAVCTHALLDSTTPPQTTHALTSAHLTRAQKS